MPTQPTRSRPRRLRKPLLALGLAATTATIVVAPQAAMATGCANTTQAPGEVSIGDFEQATVCLVNAERTSRGLVALRESSELDDAAHGHSAEMQQRSYFGHDSADGSAFDTRIFASGYVSPNQAGIRWGVGENLAWGSLQLGTAEAIDTAWMNSPHHRDNILNPDFREIGVAAVAGSPLDVAGVGVIVTHDFGFINATKPSAAHKRPKKNCAKSAKRRKATTRCSRARRARG